jgi:hypothetical protein
MGFQKTVRTGTSETCINKFQRGYQPRKNIVKGENGDLLANVFSSQLLNVHNVSDVLLNH